MKKKLWKQWRFWLEVVLGLLVVFFAFAAFALGNEISDMNDALAKYNYFYDSDEKDIFINSDKLTSTEKNKAQYGKTLLEPNEFANLLDQLVLMAEDPNSFDYEEAESVLTDLESELYIRKITTQEKENGKDMISQILEIYSNADKYDKEITDTATSIIANNLSEISKLLPKTYKN
ncbi:hypothetical protein [Streptococcus jiangjianxini]|uniref:hypothetical protein n=1 Tax=Streptococcus jiangjianxini TaxID=3161189 RepID=UPI0032EEE37B